MSFMKMLGGYCMFISFWGVIQLALMGWFFHMEAVVLFEDAHSHEKDYKTYEEFIADTKRNYEWVKINCWIAAGAYGVTFIVSLCCVVQASSAEKFEEKLNEDDDRMCVPPMPFKPIIMDSSMPTEFVYTKAVLEK